MADDDTLNEPLATDPQHLREQAVRSLKKRRDFKTHLAVYLTVNVVVWGIWGTMAATGGGTYPWPIFVTLGWGIGVVMNAYDVYAIKPITEDAIAEEERRLASSTAHRRGHRR